jgi:elongation factor G
VWLRLEPRARGEGFEWTDEVVGGAVPSRFIPAAEKGVVEAMQHGPLTGCQVIDVRATIYDGSYHTVDSSEMAFKVAGSMAFKSAMEKADPVLLEPVYEVTVTVPEEMMGDVMGDVSGRRGKILGMDAKGKYQIIRALVPLAEMHQYSTHLRSLTQGRGSHEMKFSSYEEVPRDQTEKVVAELKAQREEEQLAH